MDREDYDSENSHIWILFITKSKTIKNVLLIKSKLLVYVLLVYITYTF